MSTSSIIEDDGACPTDGRNTKKVQFKDNGVDTVEMPVDVMSASTVSWKDLLLRNSVESSQYNHVKELCSFSCSDKEEANSTVGVSAEDTIEFVPWIVVERRPRQNLKESRKSAVKILFKKGDFLKLIENEAIKKKEVEGFQSKKVWVANLVANSKGAEMGKAPRLNLDLASSIGVATRNFFTSNRALEPGEMDFPHVGPPITSNLGANDASSPKESEKK
ncbi:hypothetical protein GOBAR_DD07387 [Gossypium barbadense]|nr:hypothetical protein GOBAR_DD07387 [Gossypium barbadense]